MLGYFVQTLEADPVAQTPPAKKSDGRLTGELTLAGCLLLGCSRDTTESGSDNATCWKTNSTTKYDLAAKPKCDWTQRRKSIWLVCRSDLADEVACG